jgi:hypothetical protein
MGGSHPGQLRDVGESQGFFRALFHAGEGFF